MKQVFRKFMISVLIVCMIAAIGCSKSNPNPKLSEDPDRFFAAWDEASLSAVDTGIIRNKLSFDFPDERNMEIHEGLVSPEAFTGPILCFAGDSSSYFNHVYIPDRNVRDYLSDPQIPDSAELIVYTGTAEKIPAEYLSDEKLISLQEKKLSVVFAVVECTGYVRSSVYYSPSGSEMAVCWLGWRVSFYSYPDCELLGWEAAERPYSDPEGMALDSVYSDGNGNHVYINDATGARVNVTDVTMKLLYGESYGKKSANPVPSQTTDGSSTYSYDSEGRIKRNDIHDENGDLIEYIDYTYHVSGVLVKKTCYHADGHKAWEMLFRTDGSVSMYATYHANGNYDTVTEYDDSGNATKSTHFDEAGNTID